MPKAKPISLYPFEVEKAVEMLRKVSPETTKAIKSSPGNLKDRVVATNDNRSHYPFKRRKDARHPISSERNQSINRFYSPVE